MNDRNRLLRRSYERLLGLYPASFRAEFQEEMGQVFADALTVALAGGGGAVARLCLREMATLPGAAGREWVSELRARRFAGKGATMESGEAFRGPGAQSDCPPVQPVTWGQALLAAAALLVTGLGLALTGIPALHPWNRALMFGPCLLVLLGLVVAWLRSFPRWSYPYTGYALLFALWMSRVSTPGLTMVGYTFGRNDPWGWRAWLPLAVALLLGIVLARSLRPAVRFVTRAWHDWTLLSLSLYGGLPLLIWLCFDEVHGPLPAGFQVATSLFLAAGAVAYMRSSAGLGRALSLLAGLSAAWLLTTAGVSAYWHGFHRPYASEPYHWSDNAVPMLVAWPVVALLLLAPVILGLLRRGVQWARPSP